MRTPKSMVWLVTTLMGDIGAHLLLDGGNLSSIAWKAFQDLIRAGSDGRNTVQAGSSVWEADSTAGFSKSAVCVKGPCVETSTILCFLKFKLVLIGIFFLRVHSCHLFCFCFYNVEMNILMCAFLNSYKKYIWKISF